MGKKRTKAGDNQAQAEDKNRRSSASAQPRDEKGYFQGFRYNGRKPPKPPRKLTNRQILDYYMTPEFIDWLQEHQPRTFADIWAKLQPKELELTHHVPQVRQVFSFDPRINKILYGLEEYKDKNMSPEQQITEIKKLVGYDRPFKPDLSGLLPSKEEGQEQTEEVVEAEILGKVH